MTNYFKVPLMIIFSGVSVAIAIVVSIILSNLLNFNSVAQLLELLVTSNNVPLFRLLVTYLVGLLLLSVFYVKLFDILGMDKAYELILSIIILPVFTLGLFLYFFSDLVLPILGSNLINLILVQSLPLFAKKDVTRINTFITVIGLLGSLMMFYFMGAVNTNHENGDGFLIIAVILFVIMIIVGGIGAFIF